jgi:hypothetical protein
MPGGTKGLEIRFVRYEGSTNGSMVIENKNSAGDPQSFRADGLFFVPQGDPEAAPQRLGAAGPFMPMSKDGRGDYRNVIRIEPGQTRQLALDVFCIDSHRSSPDSNTRFRVAERLLPKKLRREITQGTAKVIRDNGGDVQKAKGEIQNYMWRTRDKDWIPLEGERKDEKGPSSNRHDQTRRRRHD